MKIKIRGKSKNSLRPDTLPGNVADDRRRYELSHPTTVRSVQLINLNTINYSKFIFYLTI